MEENCHLLNTSPRGAVVKSNQESHTSLPGGKVRGQKNGPKFFHAPKKDFFEIVNLELR